MKKVTGIISSIALSLSVATPAFAQAGKITLCPSGSDFGGLCSFASKPIGGIISNILVILLIIAVIIALVYLIWGGIKWIVSGGDKAAIEQARSHVVGAIVGLVIAFAAFFIINFITSIFLGTPLGFVTLPKF